MGKLHHARGDKAFLLGNNIVLVFAFLIVAYPLIYIISASFSSTSAVISGRVWLFPVEPSLAGYKAVFENEYIMSGYRNTIFYTVTGTLVNVVLTVLAAYPLSRPDFGARKFLMLLFTFTMFFGGGLIPHYLLVKQLGMVNTFWAMIIPGALSIYNMIITRTYFQSNLSKDLLEAAQIDGCSDAKFLVSIVLPLSKAILAVITLFYAIHHWNVYLSALIYLSDKKTFPLQLVLRDILLLNQIDMDMFLSVEEADARIGLTELLKYSLIIVASAPVLCLYPIVQKYFVKGVMIGSVKA